MKIIIIILLLIILMCVISLFFYIRNQPQIVSYQPQPQPQPEKTQQPQQSTIKIITQPQVPMYNRYIPPPAPYPDLAGNYYYHGNPYIKPKRRWWNWY